MTRIPLNRTKTGVELDDAVVASISRFEVSGSLDRDKMRTALAALRLAAIRTRKIKVLSVGMLAEHFSRFSTEIASSLGIAPTVHAFGIDASLDEMASVAPDVLFLSIPEHSVAFQDLLQTIPARMPLGSTIFLASYSDVVRQDTVVPSRMISELIERNGFVALHTSYFGLFRKPLVPPPPPSPPLSVDEQKRCVFILGHARSGSSALCHVMNEQPDVHLTFEANWFMYRNRTNPVEQFNLQREFYGGRDVQKSYFLPNLRQTDVTVPDLFRHHLASRAFFGDKIAIGVREGKWSEHPVVPMLVYQLTEFPIANYALCLRDPLASIAAQNRIVQRAAPSELVLWWLETVTRLFEFFAVTDRCVVMPFAKLATGDLRPLEQLLGRPLPHGNFVFSEGAITTQSKEIESFWSGTPVKLRFIADAAQAKYAALTAMIADDTGRLRPDANRGEFLECLSAMRNLIADNADMLT